MWHKPRADKAATWRAISSPWQGTPTAQSHTSDFPRNGANHWDRSWGLRLDPACKVKRRATWAV
eukprot:140384-Amphidinium_carterae.1